VTPLVGEPAADQQNRRAENREREQQPRGTFSISSTDMKIRIMLRRTSTPTAPMTNKMTARKT
jgi:hypothetical protein